MELLTVSDPLPRVKRPPFQEVHGWEIEDTTSADLVCAAGQESFPPYNVGTSLSAATFASYNVPISVIYNLTDIEWAKKKCCGPRKAFGAY